MYRAFTVSVLAVALTGCTSVFDTIEKYNYNPLMPNYDAKAEIEADKVRAKASQERISELIRQGAMDPYDRMRVEAERDYLDAKIEAEMYAKYGYLPD